MLKKEYSVRELLCFSKTSSTPKKSFSIYGKLKFFTKRLHWYKSERIFTNNNPYLNLIPFTCKICNVTIKIKFPKTENLSHHLFRDKHEDFFTWNKNECRKGCVIAESSFDLIRYIVSTYGSLLQIKNPDFLRIVKPSIRNAITSYYSFRYKKMPELFKILKNCIGERLHQANNISLVTDIWTNSVMADFIGVAAFCSYELGYSELLIIGLNKMDGKHEAEVIKKAIENIINKYSFNKKKISGNFFAAI